MPDLKGTLSNTLPPAGQSEDEKIALQTASLAQRLLNQFAPPSAPSTIDVERSLSPLLQDIEARQAPAPLPVPGAPRGLALAAGLTTAAIGAALLRQPQLAAQTVATARNAIERQHAVEAANVAAQNEFMQKKQRDGLALRQQILTKKLEQEIRGESFDRAEKTQKNLTIVTGALDRMDLVFEERGRNARQAAALAVQEKVGLTTAMLNFIGRLSSADNNSGGLNPAQETSQLNNLIDTMRQIGLRIAPEGPNLFKLRFTKTVSDEEAGLQIQTMGAFISGSSSPRVRKAAVFAVQSVLQEKFGDDFQKKQEFLIKMGGQSLIAEGALQSPEAQPLTEDIQADFGLNQ